ncbi:MAG: hypothetical protein EP319_08275 [Deltaproteobacteria bacterium]|nr:MAG: hypothetical protein EP319_08275 [Deltaproteobacteria bacterium]
MKSLYSKFSEESFKIVSIILMLLGDFVVCRWLWVKFVHNPNLEYMIRFQVKLLKKNPGFQNIDIPPDFHEQIIATLQKGLIITFILVVGFHLLNYLGLWTNKVLAFYYLRFMAWTAGLGTLIIGLTSFGELGALAGALTFVGLAYFFVAIGFIYFPMKKNEESKI